MTVPPPDPRRSEWMADLEEVADLAAEMAPPEQVPAARTRRRGWSAAGLVALLAGAPGGAAAAAGRRRMVPRRRLLGTGLAMAGTLGLGIGLLLHLPGPDPLPLSGGGRAYTTPTPDTATGGVALQTTPLDPSSPAPLITPLAPLSSQAPRAATVHPSTPGGAAPAPTSSVNFSPVIPAPASQAPQPPPSASSAPPASAAPSPSATAAGPPVVSGVTLSAGTCQNRTGWWYCPVSATFTIQPGAQGTLVFSFAGTDVSCSGASSAFDQGRQQVTIPQGTTRAVVTAELVFAASDHPAVAGPGGAPSTVSVQVASPNHTASASQAFGSASCP